MRFELAIIYSCQPPRSTVLFSHGSKIIQIYRQVSIIRMVVVAFSSRVRILGECSTIHSLPVFFFLFFLSLFKAEIRFSASMGAVLSQRVFIAAHQEK